MRRTFFIFSVLLLSLILCGLIASWAGSYWWRHGVVVTGWREYAMRAERGRLEVRRAVRTDVAFAADGTPSVHEVPFGRTPGTAVFRFYSASQLTLDSSHSIFRACTRLRGGEVPRVVPQPGNVITIEYLDYGEITTAWSIPHWFAIHICAAQLVLCAIGENRRRRRSWVGLCRGCGYDLRATPERCPECGQFTGSTGESPNGPRSHEVADERF